MVSNKRSFGDLDGGLQSESPAKRNTSEEREEREERGQFAVEENGDQPATPSIHDNVQDLSISQDIPQIWSFVKANLSNSLERGQFWFVIPKPWLDQLERRAMGETDGEIPSIPTDTITDGSDLLPNLQLGVEIEIVPEEVHTKLEDWWVLRVITYVANGVPR